MKIYQHRITEAVARQVFDSIDKTESKYLVSHKDDRTEYISGDIIENGTDWVQTYPEKKHDSKEVLKEQMDILRKLFINKPPSIQILLKKDRQYLAEGILEKGGFIELQQGEMVFVTPPVPKAILEYIEHLEKMI